VLAPQVVSVTPTAAETAFSIKYAPRMLCALQSYAAVMLPRLCERLGAIGNAVRTPTVVNRPVGTVMATVSLIAVPLKVPRCGGADACW
jgi:hypothetical protein